MILCDIRYKRDYTSIPVKGVASSVIEKKMLDILHAINFPGKQVLFIFFIPSETCFSILFILVLPQSVLSSQLLKYSIGFIS